MMVAASSGVVVDLGLDTVVCNSYTLDAGNPGQSYLWNDSSTSQQITVTQSGTYHVQVTDTNGCTGADTVIVTILTQPIAYPYIITQTGQTVSFGDSSKGGNLSYLWDFGDGSTSTLPNPTHTFSPMFAPTVVVTVTNKCGTAQAFFETTGPIGNLKSQLFGENISIFPNPGDGRLNVTFGKIYQDLILEVINIRGRIIKSSPIDIPGQQLDIDLSDLPKGTYFLRFRSGELIATKKLTIL
ncbi:MAG: T9SS type A sorting domain-containing protein [Bacteroidota bacterium]